MMNALLTDAGQLARILAPIAGKVRIRPARGARWRGKLRAAQLRQVGMFAIDADGIRVHQSERPRDFVGVTIPQSAPFSVKESRQLKVFEGANAHVLHPYREFDLRTGRSTRLLVANFFLPGLEDYARRLGDLDSLPDLKNYRVSLASPAGSSLSRCMYFVWGELIRSGSILSSELVASEVEDALVAALVWTLREQNEEDSGNRYDCADPRIDRAEEYLLAHLSRPLSRAALAEVSGVSIRTLSRGFLKRHGTGPMSFLKQRRLDAARSDLMAGEPGATSVTEVAMRYGFSELSKFSAAYKAAFGESPSDTLWR